MATKNLVAYQFTLALDLGTGSYEVVNDMETMSFTMNGDVQTWSSYSDKGWKKRLVTGKDGSFAFSGKYNQGDSTHEKLLKIMFGDIASHNKVNYKLTFPSGSGISEISGAGVINFTGTNLLGAANDVSPLSFEVQMNGAPSVK